MVTFIPFLVLLIDPPSMFHHICIYHAHKHTIPIHPDTQSVGPARTAPHESAFWSVAEVGKHAFHAPYIRVWPVDFKCVLFTSPRSLQPSLLHPNFRMHREADHARVHTIRPITCIIHGHGHTFTFTHSGTHSTWPRGQRRRRWRPRRAAAAVCGESEVFNLPRLHVQTVRDHKRAHTHTHEHIHPGTHETRGTHTKNGYYFSSTGKTNAA